MMFVVDFVSNNLSIAVRISRYFTVTFNNIIRKFSWETTSIETFLIRYSTSLSYTIIRS